MWLAVHCALLSAVTILGILHFCFFDFFQVFGVCISLPVFGSISIPDLDYSLEVSACTVSTLAFMQLLQAYQ